MRPGHHTQNRFDVDLRAIAANVATVRRSIGAGVWLCVALKADAYGFGLLPVAKTVLDAGADAVAVGFVADGITLRQHRIRAPILVYGGERLGPSSVRELEQYRLIGTVHNADSLRMCRQSARRGLEVMIEVDVGLWRLGFDRHDVAQVAEAIRAEDALRLRGIYTHMRVEARPDARGMKNQFAAFLAALRSAGPVPLTIAASSRVLDRSSAMVLNGVDVGRAVYGLLPSRSGRLGPRLKPAFARLRSQLTTLKPVPPQSRTGSLAAVRLLGVIPFGRASGMPGISVGAVLIRGRRARVVGAPSLEHTRIDLSRHPTARVGDEVVVLGRQGTAEISAAEVLRAHPELPDSALALQVGAAVERFYLN